jgi:hypothetical protein
MYTLFNWRDHREKRAAVQQKFNELRALGKEKQR